MAKSSIRPSSSDDAPALAALMAEAGLIPNSEPGALRWRYWLERPEFPGPRSFVLTRNGELLAHAAIIPGVIRCWDERRIRTLHIIDWAALPSATGAGVSLMKYLGQGTDALLAIGGSAQTLKLLPHLGYKTHGTATCFVRTLHPTRILTPSIHPTWKLPARLARSMLWSLQAPSGGTEGWSATRITAAELARVAATLPLPRREMAVFERDAESFRYILGCPSVEAQMFVVERAGRARGYFLLTFALRQARLADCWLDSEDAAEWGALIQCAVQAAKRHARAAELAAWASDPLLPRSLLACGFHDRGGLPVQLLGPRAAALSAGILRVQMLDNDAAYRHNGRNEFWA
jgi:hypothetical protein